MENMNIFDLIKKMFNKDNLKDLNDAEKIEFMKKFLNILNDDKYKDAKLISVIVTGF